jgi:hypothetical protein
VSLAPQTGSLERFGELLSGTIIVIVGVLFFFWSPKITTHRGVEKTAENYRA